jgi:hypothetical protein
MQPNLGMNVTFIFLKLRAIQGKNDVCIPSISSAQLPVFVFQMMWAICAKAPTTNPLKINILCNSISQCHPISLQSGFPDYDFT